MSRAKKVCQNSEQKMEVFENIGSSLPPLIPQPLRIQLMLNALQFNNNNHTDVSQQIKLVVPGASEDWPVIPDFRTVLF